MHTSSPQQRKIGARGMHHLLRIYSGPLDLTHRHTLWSDMLRNSHKQLLCIVPLKKIEYGFGKYYNKIPIYPIFYLLKGGSRDLGTQQAAGICFVS